MIPRPFWIKRIRDAWKEAPIAWLTGVRRCGKTTLAQSLGGHYLYLDSDLPSTHQRVSNPELFYQNCREEIVVFDEIHQLPEPTRLLKIGADHYPRLKILATGSSTLAASHKFRDTLSGRKRIIHLTPVLWDELEAFNDTTAIKRLYHGGLPQALLEQRKPHAFYREWLDSFFARDLQRLFAFRNPDKFNQFFEFIIRQNGGLFESNKASRSLGISRPTVESHLRALEVMHAVTILRPFFGGGQKEIVKSPKIYAFDTGFVSFCRGWDPLRQDDYGQLWENLFLEFVQAHGHLLHIHYWRDTGGREVDFVIPQSRNRVDALECKWDISQLDPSALKMFRTYYPDGDNYLICPLKVPAYKRIFAGIELIVCNPDGWRQKALGKGG